MWVFDTFNIAGAPAKITLHYLGENSNPPTVLAQGRNANRQHKVSNLCSNHCSLLGGSAQFVENSADPVELGQVAVNDSDHEV